MAGARRVAVVTGSNQGIGREIARNLAKSHHVILACRNPAAGAQAVSELASEGLNCEFLQCDIGDSSSISAFSAALAQKHGDNLEILVNNAAIAFKSSDSTPFSLQAEPTFHINYFGTKELTTALLPLLRRCPDSKIVNVASMAGHLKIFPSTPAGIAKRGEVERAAASGSVELVDALAREFISSVQTGGHVESGFPNTCYGTSKLCLIAYTKALAIAEPSISINACCPGYVATNMSSHRGNLTPAQGAATPTMLALLGDKTTGEFWRECKKAVW